MSEILLCRFCGKLPGTKVGPPAMARCIAEGCEGRNLAAVTVAEWYATTQASAPRSASAGDGVRVGAAHYAEGEAPWSEDEQFEEAQKACDRRLAKYGDGDMCERDGACSECVYDACDRLARKYAPSRKAAPPTVRIDQDVGIREALERVIKANDEFRASLPDGWEGDPLNDACTEAKAVLASNPLEGKGGK